MLTSFLVRVFIYSGWWPGSHLFFPSSRNFTFDLSLPLPSISSLNATLILLAISLLLICFLVVRAFSSSPILSACVLFSSVQLDGSVLCSRALRVWLFPLVILLCILSLFLFVIVIGSRRPVSMYRHSLGVDWGVLRIRFIMLSYILLISSSSFFVAFHTSPL